MARPTTRTELLDRMEAEFAALMSEVEQLGPDDVNRPGACEEWSPKDLLAHLDAWHRMLCDWEAIGTRGGRPDMPAPGYSWSQIPALNEAIWLRTRHDDTDEVKERLAESYRQVREVVASYDDEALFQKRRFAWTGTTSVGSYAVSATSSHYAWAAKLIRRFRKSAASD